MIMLCETSQWSTIFKSIYEQEALLSSGMRIECPIYFIGLSQKSGKHGKYFLKIDVVNQISS